MNTCKGTTNVGVSCANKIKETEHYCHLHDPEKVGYEIPFDCPRCHISGFARIADAEQPALIECSQCNQQFLYAWCKPCGFGGDFLHDVSARPNEVQCASCGDIQKVPDASYEDENIHRLYRLKKQQHSEFSRWWKGLTSYQKKVASVIGLIVLIPCLPIYRENTVYFSATLVYLFWVVLLPLSLLIIYSQTRLRTVKRPILIYSVFSVYVMFDVSLLVEESMNQFNQKPHSLYVVQLSFDSRTSSTKGALPWTCDWYVRIQLSDKSGHRVCAENIVGKYDIYEDDLYQLRFFNPKGPAVLEGRISWAGFVADRMEFLAEK